MQAAFQRQEEGREECEGVRGGDTGLSDSDTSDLQGVGGLKNELFAKQGLEWRNP